MWDLSILGVVPGLRIAAPRDEPTLREELREAVDVSEGPTVVRYPKTALGADLPALRRVGGVDVLAETPGRPADVLLVSVGAVAHTAMEVAERVADQGIVATVVDPRWVKPVDPALLDLARTHRIVVTVEDNGRSGGVGAALSQALRDAEIDVPTRDVGIPQQFLAHGKPAEVHAEIGLTPQAIARRVVEWVSRLHPAEVDVAPS
jgi:1-deoxy-D-xylulose-5-phosphate synthase